MKGALLILVFLLFDPDHDSDDYRGIVNHLNHSLYNFDIIEIALWCLIALSSFITTYLTILVSFVSILALNDFVVRNGTYFCRFLVNFSLNLIMIGIFKTTKIFQAGNYPLTKCLCGNGFEGTSRRNDKKKCRKEFEAGDKFKKHALV